MIVKLTLENFLAHSRTVLELGPGVTVLTGPNNSGKSAVVEALRCLAENPAPKHFIRHGATKARVEAELEDGTRIAWVRKKASAIYEVFPPGADEPAVYAKFGRTPPQDVLNLLRINPVLLEGGEAMDVHIGNQREPIFLLNKPATAAAAFFAASTESAHLLSMQAGLKRRTQEAKREEQALAAKAQGLTADLDRLAPLPDLALSLDSARDKSSRLATLAKDLPDLEGLLARRETLLRERGRRARTAEAAGRATPPPALAPAARLDADAARLDAARKAQAQTAARAAALSPLAPPPALLPAAPLAGLIRDRQRLAAASAQAAARAAALSPLAAPAEPFPAAALADRLDRLQTCRNRASAASARAAALASLPPPPQTADPADLADLLDSLASLRRKSAAQAERLSDLQSALRDFRARLAERLAHIGSCPLCGAQLTEDHFLDQEADRAL